MHPLTAKLVELQRIESSNPVTDSVTAQIQTLRRDIPATVLGHYDRLRAAGKVPVAVVLNGSCQGCHLRLSSGAQAQLLNKDDLHLCEHCGRYIYPLRPQADEPGHAVATPAPRVRRKRARWGSLTPAS